MLDQRSKAAVEDLDLEIVYNAHFAEGLSTSLKAGIGMVPAECAGALVLLADMPLVEPRMIDRLIDRAEQRHAADAVVLSHEGRWGNPVLLCRSMFDRVHRLEGDLGARKLLEDPSLHIEVVDHSNPATFNDIDEPSDLLNLAAASRRG